MLTLSELLPNSPDIGINIIHIEFHANNCSILPYFTVKQLFNNSSLIQKESFRGTEILSLQKFNKIWHLSIDEPSLLNSSDLHKSEVM